MSPPRRAELKVGEVASGRRLDVFLATELGIGRRTAQGLVGEDRVRLNGRRARKGDLVQAGDRVEVSGVDGPAHRVVPDPSGPWMELARGPGWVAVDKPAGVPVHPLRPGETGTLLNRLVVEFPAAQGVGEGNLRSGVVHRLDVDTSGAMVFGLDAATWTDLREAFAAHRARKTYRALVQGRLEGTGREDVSLLIHRHRPAHVRVTEPGTPGARSCQTAWSALETRGDITLVELQPRTGFLHQIRATMAHLGHPLVGDRAYGAIDDAPRHMLHASDLQVGPVDVRSPDPGDFLARWEGRGDA